MLFRKQKGYYMNHATLGHKIRKERNKQQLTQEQLAEKINISTAYMGFIERGERNISLDKLSLLASVLGVSIDYLLSDGIGTSTSDKETLMMSLFSSATENEKDLILDIAKTILKHSKKVPDI